MGCIERFGLRDRQHDAAPSDHVCCLEHGESGEHLSRISQCVYSERFIKGHWRYESSFNNMKLRMLA